MRSRGWESPLEVRSWAAPRLAEAERSASAMMGVGGRIEEARIVEQVSTCVGGAPRETDFVETYRADTELGVEGLAEFADVVEWSGH